MVLSKREYDNLAELQDTIKQSIADNDFDTLNAKISILEGHEFVSPQFKSEVQKNYNRMKKELELHDFLKNLAVNIDYKKIKMNITAIDKFLESCKEENIYLGENAVNEAKYLQQKLMAERNLRYHTLELVSKPVAYKVLDE